MDLIYAFSLIGIEWASNEPTREDVVNTMSSFIGWDPSHMIWDITIGNTHRPSTPRKHALFYECNGPLARYVKLQVAHAPGIPGTFSPPPQVSDPDMHHGTCVTHVPWCMPGSLTSSFLWCRWRGKCSRYSRRTRNPQFHLSGKRPMR